MGVAHALIFKSTNVRMGSNMFYAIQNSGIHQNKNVWNPTMKGWRLLVDTFLSKWANSSGHFLRYEFSWTLLVTSRGHILGEF